MLAGLLCRGGASWPPYITTAWPSAFLAWPGRSPSSVRATPGDAASERLSVPAGRLASGGRRGRRCSHSEPGSSPASQRAGLRMNI